MARQFNSNPMSTPATRAGSGGNKNVGKGPGNAGSPMTVSPKSTQGKGAQGASPALGKGNPVRIGGSGNSPSFSGAGIGSPGKSPGTPSTKTGRDYTSHPYKGRNTPPSPVPTGSGKNWANGKSGNRP